MSVQARCNFKYLELTITLNAPAGQIATNLSLALPLSLSFSPFYNMLCLTILYACQAHGHKYGQTTLKTSWILAVLVIRHCGSPFEASPLRICLIQTYPRCTRGTDPNAGIQCAESALLAFLISACKGGKLLSSAIRNSLGVRELKCVLESKKALELLLNCH